MPYRSRKWYWPLIMVGLGFTTACTAQQMQASSGYVNTALADVQRVCDKVLPLANAAEMIPQIGIFVAAGVQVGCGTVAGIDKLAADPTSVAWLRQQQMILQAATARGK